MTVDITSMTDLNINTIISLYLYGALSIPTEYTDRLRSQEEYNNLKFLPGANV